MMYLIGQTALFLAIACLIGIVVGYFLARDQRSERQAQLESEALDARHRAIAIEKEIDEYKTRLADLEGLPQGVRASRIAARDEMLSRMSQLERELGQTQANEKRLGEESARLKVEVDAFRSRYLEARAKWDEYQAKAEALASAPQPLNLGAAHIVPDESMRKRVLELEALLNETGKERDRLAEQARSFSVRAKDLERQVANSSQGSDRSIDAMKSLQAKISELEGSLALAARERDGAAQQSQSLLTRTRELEKQIAAAGQGSSTAQEATKALLGRVTELEGSLVSAARDRDDASVQAQALTARLSEAERRLSETGQGSERNAKMARTLKSRVTELESRLASGFVVARETDGLRSRVADLQDKLGEAEVALSKAIATTRQETEPLKKRIAELEGRLATASILPASSESLADTQAIQTVELSAKLLDAENERANFAAEVSALKGRIAELETSRPVVLEADSHHLTNRIAELETALEKARKQALETVPLRTQIVSLEARLADANAVAARGSANEDVGLLKARLADVESRLMSSSQSSMEHDNLRNRVITLEALLHEAAKSRDEAAVLRSKVAELDGRLGQAMKSIAETKPRKIESEGV